MTAPRVATVVLNYRATQDTVRAVGAVRRSTVLDQLVVVVDNAARGPEHDDLRARLGSGIECLTSGGNLGYAGGNNVGIRFALDREVDFVWVLNPDTEVEPTTLERLLAAADAVPDAGTIGGRLLLPNGRIQFDGGLVDEARLGAPSHLNAGLKPKAVAATGPYDVDYVNGACLLIRRAVFDRVGLLPEEFFLYFEETSFCRDVRAAGWRNIVDPRASLLHLVRSRPGLPTPYYLYYMTRNRLHFAQRYFDADLDLALAIWTEDFLGRWRARVEQEAPGWLDTFDALVELAVADARGGIFGRVPAVEKFPNPPAAGSSPAV